MHNFIVNASIQVVPVTQARHPYEWVDEVIALIVQSGIKYEVGPFATVLEGTYDDVMKVFHAVNELLLEKNCPEWITNLQVHTRSTEDMTTAVKTGKFH